jgi:hypothetical protein
MLPGEFKNGFGIGHGISFAVSSDSAWQSLALSRTEESNAR